MGNVTLWMQMSLDGLAEGPDEQIEWPIVDEELCESFMERLRGMDMFLYGRKTYEIMAAFWPTADVDPAISEFYIQFARCWKQTPKMVFSETLETAGWDTTIVRDNLVDEITALKAQPDFEMALFGGADVASTFMEHDLIDEYRLFVHPVLLGSGTPLFPSSIDTADLKLVNVLTFDSAVVHMHYQRERPNPPVAEQVDHAELSAEPDDSAPIPGQSVSWLGPSAERPATERFTRPALKTPASAKMEFATRRSCP